MKAAFPLAQVDQLIQSLAAKDLEYSIAHGLDRSYVQQFRRSIQELKSLIRMRQAVVRHQGGDVRKFSLFRAQKLLARGNVEEEIANRNRGSRRPGDLIAAQHFPAGNLDARACDLIRRSCFHH